MLASAVLDVWWEFLLPSSYLHFSDPCQMQDNWKLSEGFVAEEAKALLPHRATGRYILFNNLCQSAWLHCKSNE